MTSDTTNTSNGSDEPNRDAFLLDAAAARAVDAWLTAHASGMQLHSADERATRVNELLAMLGSVPNDVNDLDKDDSQAKAQRVERVLDFLASAGAFAHCVDDHDDQVDQIDQGVPTGPTLHPLDDDALYALVMAGFRAERVPASLRERAHKHVALSELVSGAHVPVPADDLVDRTLAKIEHANEVVHESEQIESVRAGWFRSKFRLADVAGIAAMLIVGASVVVPVFGHFRREARRFACDSNLAQAGLAFANYAHDNSDRLPVVSERGNPRVDQQSIRPWSQVGSPTGSSNSANLYVLVSKEYLPIHDLACPCNDHARRELPDQPSADWLTDQEVSYSYRIVAGVPTRDLVTRPTTVLLTDRSPIMSKNSRGLHAMPEENSENHNGRGQTVLFGDGSTRWMTSPILGGSGSQSSAGRDNIWLPRSVELVLDQLTGRSTQLLQGVEAPESASDNFVGP